MKEPTRIGIKYVVLGLVSYAICAFSLTHLLGHAVGAGTGAGVMAVMVIAATDDYKAGRKAAAPA